VDIRQNISNQQKSSKIRSGSSRREINHKKHSWGTTNMSNHKC